MDILGMNVLSVDDNANNLLIVEAFSKKIGLNIRSFTNPIEALEHTKTTQYDILIVDYMMPEMDGLQFISEFRKKDENTPIIMITAAGDDPKLQLEALKLGATDFLSKPVNGAIFQARINNLLKLKKSLKLLSNRAMLLQSEIDKATKQIKDRELEALNKLGKVSEYKDPETNAHVIRVAAYSKIIAKHYGLSEEMQDYIYYASPLHDIGKVGIADAILLKPDKLEGEEWETMKSHSWVGHEILKDSKSIYLKYGSVVSFTHHERYDGTGYPNGLSGDMIPLFGRIVAIADVFDALSSNRPYKKAWSFEEALNYIKDQKGKHFDPRCVDCFVEAIDEIEQVYETYCD